MCTQYPGEPTAARPRLRLVLLVSLALLAGCSTRVKVINTDPEFARRLAAADIVALGGVTVAPMIGAELAPADAFAAAEALFRAFLSGRPDLAAWPAPTVGEKLGDDVLSVLLAEYGRLGRLRVDQLLPLAEPLHGCRFLALARLTDDAIRSQVLDQDGFDPNRPTAEHPRPLTQSVTTERAVTVTLEIFDLASGRSVWQGEARARERERYRYQDRLQREPSAYLQERLAAADSPRYLPRQGEFLQMPDLIDLLEQALSGLVQRLPEPERR